MVRPATGIPTTHRTSAGGKGALAKLGRYPDRKLHNGLIDRDLVNAIDSYQRDRGLKRDGLLRPDGETEQTIKVELTYLRED